MISVADSVESIQSALKEASEHADIVISTGGLGPTSDDVTKQVLCRYFQTSLILHQPTLEHIRQLFAARNMQMNELNAAQAMLPASRAGTLLIPMEPLRDSGLKKRKEFYFPSGCAFRNESYIA
jgi:molybdopterin-biosynthesis enzyme MoeA-like protein